MFLHVKCTVVFGPTAHLQHHVCTRVCVQENRTQTFSLTHFRLSLSPTNGLNYDCSSYRWNHLQRHTRRLFKEFCTVPIYSTKQIHVRHTSIHHLVEEEIQNHFNRLYSVNGSLLITLVKGDRFTSFFVRIVVRLLNSRLSCFHVAAFNLKLRV